MLSTMASEGDHEYVNVVSAGLVLSSRTGGGGINEKIFSGVQTASTIARIGDSVTRNLKLIPTRTVEKGYLLSVSSEF